MSSPLKSAQFSIIGPGRVGTTLAALLHRNGFSIQTVVGRTLESASKAVQFSGAGSPTTDPAEVRGSDVVLLTTPDGVLESVARSLATLSPPLAPETIIAHCSGALPASHLSALGNLGIRIGSLHPIQTFARPQEAIDQLGGTVWGIEGDPAVYATLSELVTSLDGTPIEISPGPGKALYHASAVVTSNYLVTLLDLALTLAKEAGLSRDQALQALIPLAHTTLSNLSSLPDTSSALTGPIARGDRETIAKHLQAIESVIPQIGPLYRGIGRSTIEIARRKGGASEEDLRAIETLLNGPDV